MDIKRYPIFECGSMTNYFEAIVMKPTLIRNELTKKIRESKFNYY